MLISLLQVKLFFFFFNDTATTEIYTLSLHDALPIFSARIAARGLDRSCRTFCSAARSSSIRAAIGTGPGSEDRKSTRLNSSHSQISYAVFCLKKKKLKKDFKSLEMARTHQAGIPTKP